jgi:hypothetical protein
VTHGLALIWIRPLAHMCRYGRVPGSGLVLAAGLFCTSLSDLCADTLWLGLGGDSAGPRLSVWPSEEVGNVSVWTACRS